MNSDQYAHSMTLVIWVAILCIAVIGFGIVGGAAKSTTAEADTEQTFAVNITELNTSVTEGDTLVVKATISNEGSVTDSQQIHLKNDDNEILDSIAGPPVTLEPDESRNVTLTWETGPDDAMTGEVRVVSNQGQDSREVQIEEGAFITIESVDSNSPVSPGNTLNTTVNVTNSNNHSTTRNVWIVFDDNVVAETPVELSPGENRTVTLTWAPPTEYTGNWPLTAGTMGDQQTIGIALVEPQPAENRSEQTSSQRPPTSAEGDDEGENVASENVASESIASASETSDNEIPGFGVITVLISLVVASGLVAYRRS